MKYNIVKNNPRAITIELENKTAFYNKENYSVYLNNELIYKDINTNVFTLFSLEPGTTYELKFDENGKATKITTKEEKFFINVKNCNVKGDGKSDDTSAIQSLILSMPADTTIYFPKGTYCINPIFLKSNISLYLDKDAVLLANNDRTTFPIIPGYLESYDGKTEVTVASWEGNPLECFASIVSCFEVENVTIYGQGTINGNAKDSDWWHDPKGKNMAYRPRTVQMTRSKNVTLQGITVCNSPSWTIHPLQSENIDLINIFVTNPADSPNTDGIDPESSENINIIGTEVSVGDDCVVLKSGKIYMAQNHYKPTRNVLVRNCLMRDGHGSFVLGSELACGILDVMVTQCKFLNTDRGLRIKTRRGRSNKSILDNITFDNIEMEDVLAPFTMNMFYRCDPDGDTEYVFNKEALPVDDRTPKLGKFKFSNINALNCHWTAGYFAGLPESKIEQIHFQNVNITMKDKATSGSPIMVTHPIRPNDHSASKEGLVLYNVNKLILENTKIEGANQEIDSINVDSIEKI